MDLSCRPFSESFGSCWDLKTCHTGRLSQTRPRSLPWLQPGSGACRTVACRVEARHTVLDTCCDLGLMCFVVVERVE